jgi:transposase InsO family protein
MNLEENQLDMKIKTLRIDQGHKYLSDLFKKLYDEKRIERQLTIPTMPQQNGIAKRKNRTLFKIVRLMMAQTNLPLTY